MQFHVYDARTQHLKKGFTSLTEKIANNSTVWGLKHLPQNRDIMMVQVSAPASALVETNLASRSQGKHHLHVCIQEQALELLKSLFLSESLSRGVLVRETIRVATAR